MNRPRTLFVGIWFGLASALARVVGIALGERRKVRAYRSPLEVDHVDHQARKVINLVWLYKSGWLITLIMSIMYLINVSQRKP